MWLCVCWGGAPDRRPPLSGALLWETCLWWTTPTLKEAPKTTSPFTGHRWAGACVCVFVCWGKITIHQSLVHQRSSWCYSSGLLTVKLIVSISRLQTENSLVLKQYWIGGGMLFQVPAPHDIHEVQLFCQSPLRWQPHPVAGLASFISHRAKISLSAATGENDRRHMKKPKGHRWWLKVRYTRTHVVVVTRLWSCWLLCVLCICRVCLQIHVLKGESLSGLTFNLPAGSSLEADPGSVWNLHAALRMDFLVK